VTVVAGVLFALVVAFACAFQLALAMGAPLGTYAMGGRYPGRLPPAMRASAIVQAIVLGLLALIVLSAARLVQPNVAAGLPWLVWLPVLFSAISLVLNVVTPSAGERRIWAPVAAVLLVTSLAVALTAAPA
jgi:hypothetical protein